MHDACIITTLCMKGLRYYQRLHFGIRGKGRRNIKTKILSMLLDIEHLLIILSFKILMKSILVYKNGNDKYFKTAQIRNRSSHWRCSVRKGVLRNFAKFTGKHLCQSLFFNKVSGLGLQLY